MKFRSPKYISLVSALILSGLVFLLSAGVFQVASNTPFWGYSFLIGICTFLASYLLIFWFVEAFINSKIRLIYKNLSRLRQDKDQVEDLDMSTDILSAANKEVLSWVNENTQEIDRLREQETFRRDFIGNLAHELKTPLFTVQGSVLTLLEGGMDDERIRETFLKKAAKGMDRMINLTEDLDAISKLESGKFRADLSEFDLVELSREIMDSLEEKSEKKNITIKYNQDYDSPINVLADRSKMGQVLSNLIDNSLNYGKENGETEVRFFDMDNQVMVEVSDNGVGISETDTQRIFERFFRADKSRSRNAGGSGLGLSICKHILEAHNTTMKVRSSLGMGSTFSFMLNKA